MSARFPSETPGARSPIARRRRASSHRRGAAMVEAALVLPAILMIIIGVFEYGRYFMTLHILELAARDTARYAVAHTQDVYLGDPTNTAADATLYASSDSKLTAVFNKFAGSSTLAGQQMACYLSDDLGTNIGAWKDAEPGQSICVHVTGNFKVVIPTLIVLPTTIPVDIKVIMKAEPG